MKDSIRLAIEVSEHRCMWSRYFFAVQHGNGSQLSEYPLSLASSRCGCLRYVKTMVTIYGSSDSRARRVQKPSGKRHEQVPLTASARTNLRDCFSRIWEGCVTKGISVTFIKQEKRRRVKNDNSDGCKTFYINMYIYILIYMNIITICYIDNMSE